MKNELDFSDFEYVRLPPGEMPVALVDGFKMAIRRIQQKKSHQIPMVRLMSGGHDYLVIRRCDLQKGFRRSFEEQLLEYCGGDKNA